MGNGDNHKALLEAAQERICTVLEGAAVVPDAEPVADDEPSGLVVTAGLSPLPPLLTVREFKPTTVLLVRSLDSRLRPQDIRTHGIGVIDCVVQPDNHDDIFEKVLGSLNQSNATNDECVSWDIAYTGGTKAMSVHAHRAWKQSQVVKGTAWYLSDADMLLRSAAGVQRVLRIASGPPMAIDALARIHEASELPVEGRDREPHQLTVANMHENDGVIAADLVVAKLLLDDLIEHPNGNLQERLLILHPELINRYPHALVQNNPPKAAGIWFERLVALIVHLTGRLTYAPQSETYWSVEALLRNPHHPTRRGALCELDVCHVAGARLSAIEVKFKSTADANPIESDLLAVAQLEFRAEQLGGALSRPGFVTLRPDYMLNTLRQYSQTIDLAPRTEVFGLSEIGAVVDALLANPFCLVTLGRTALATWLAE